MKKQLVQAIFSYIIYRDKALANWGKGQYDFLTRRQKSIKPALESFARQLVKGEDGRIEEIYFAVEDPFEGEARQFYFDAITGDGGWL